MSSERPTVHDIMALLAGNQRVYAEACQQLRDPFIKDLVGQLATKLEHRAVELDRIRVMSGGETGGPMVTSDRFSECIPASFGGTDNSILGHIEYREQLTAVLCGELLRDLLLPSAIRALLQRHLNASSTILVIIGEALCSGAQRAA